MNKIDKIPFYPNFSDQDVFLIGGGTSLQNFNFDCLRYKNVVAINKAIFYINFATILYFSDMRFYTWYKDDIGKFRGLKYTTCNKIDDLSIEYINDSSEKSTEIGGIDTRKNFIRNCGNSGYGAINLAFHTGCKRIILLGYDMKNSNTGKTHFHDGYKMNSGVVRDKKDYTDFISPFKNISSILSSHGIEIINAYVNNIDDSDLKCVKQENILNFI